MTDNFSRSTKHNMILQLEKMRNGSCKIGQASHLLSARQGNDFVLQKIGGSRL